MPFRTAVSRAVLATAACAAILLARPASAEGIIIDGRTPGNAGPQIDAAEVSPAVVGAALPAAQGRTHLVQAGETLSGIAEQYGTTVQRIAARNGISDPDRVDIGQVLEVDGRSGVRLRVPEGGNLARVQLWPWPVTQGQTMVVWVQATRPVTMAITLADTTYPVTQAGRSGWAMIPFGPLVAPGVRSLAVEAGETRIEVPVSILEGEFASYNVPASVSAPILGQRVKVNDESEKVAATFATESDTGWTPRSRFVIPLADSHVVSDPFGSRRTYGGGGTVSAHAGEDFSAPPGTEVTAPAAGTVVLAEPLFVRGNAVILDHGHGVLTGYWHLQELAVEVGQQVEAGETLGKVGSTGLSTGAHLHWELRVQGAAVDPMQWVEP
jgi:murein DD-endopeptidase MepM/ murein hydrolase activator NlpD